MDTDERFPVKRRYSKSDKHRVWNILDHYKREAGNANKFATTLSSVYAENFKNGPAPIIDSSQTVSVRQIGTRRLRQYYDMDRYDAVENSNIEDASWRFLDRVSSVLRHELVPRLDPSVFDYFNSNNAGLNDVQLAQEHRSLLMTSDAIEGIRNIGIIEIGEAYGPKHLRVNLWVCLINQADSSIVHKSFREGDRSAFILWEGLMSFTLPVNRESNHKMLFSNHDSTIILHEKERRRPGALIIRNLSDIVAPEECRCTFRTPNSELDYKIEPFAAKS